MNYKSIIYKMIPVYLAIVVILPVVARQGSNAITTYIENQPVKNRRCIIIDPGHGGIDGGATSYSGVLESHINLQIALRLDDLFHLIGIETILIRDCDVSIHTQGTTIAQKKVSDLKERVKIVNESNNGVLLSIHQNHFTDSRYYGPQVFYGKGQGSTALAMSLQQALNKSLCSESNRKCKPAKGIYLLDKINHNGVLVECGFISNPMEDKKLNTIQYQNNLSCVIVATCSNFLNSNTLS